MDIRTFFSYLTPGEIPLVFDSNVLGVILAICISITMVQFVFSLTYNFKDEQTGTVLRPSIYLIFVIPLLFIASAFEALLLVFFLFSENWFAAVGMILVIYYIVKLIMSFEELFGPLQITHMAQRVSIWLFSLPDPVRDTINSFFAEREIRKIQMQYLKPK